MKTCSKCGLSKPLEEFQKRAKNKDGHAGICKLCKREYDNAHYKANTDRRQYIINNKLARRKKVQEWILQYLKEHPCIDCGESDIVVLEFDHRGDKLNHVSILIRTHALESVKKEVAKCDVRCANCHRRKTARDFGNWRLGLDKDSMVCVV